MALSWFQNYPLTRVDSLDNNLCKGNICELKFAFVLLFFKAYVKNINWAAKGANANFRTIWFPSDRSNWIVILNLFAANFIPLRSLWVEVIDIETIEVSYNGSLSGGIKHGTGEFFHSLVFWVIKSLEAITSLLIEMYLSIVSSSQNVGAPCQSIGNSSMLNFGFGLSFNIECEDSTIEMARADPLSIGRRWHSDNKWFRAIDTLTLVWL